VTAGRPPESSRGRELRELALLFLRLGATAFGGPAVHIAMMEEEVVRRRRWLAREEFLDLLGATNLIPGPNSTEMAIHVGHRRAGRAGLVVAGTCFILPAFLIVLAIAWAYVRFRTLPAADALLYGVKPVIIAIVLQALWGLARSAVKNGFLAALGLLTAAAALLGANEIGLLLGAGALMAMLSATRGAGSERSLPLLLGAGVPAAGFAATASVSVNLGVLFLSFLKIGAVLFGSGYVLLAFLRADFVERLGWLSETQLLDAIAVGQATPGPVFTTATFVGSSPGPRGIVATVGIFLPAFVFRGEWPARAAPPPLGGGGRLLDGVNVAAVVDRRGDGSSRAAIVDGSPRASPWPAPSSSSGWARSTLLMLAGGLAGLALSAAGLSP
jgi:chromate transporter